MNSSNEIRYKKIFCEHVQGKYVGEYATQMKCESVTEDWENLILHFLGNTFLTIEMAT